jgi:ABC-type transport system substrate-binding protein
VTYIGFSASVPPGNNPDFRLALAYAVDKIAVASAVAAHYGVAPRPAAGIDHPELPGYNPAVHGYPYDPARAKEFYARSGWNGPITVITSPLDTTFSETLGRAVTSTIQASLGVPVKIDSTSDFPTLVSRATAGTAPIYMISWRTNTQDYGYPSFALGIAHERFLSDPEVKARVDARDARSTEQMLLDKGLILPLFFRLTR